MPVFTGSAMYLQSELAKKEVEMDIIVPSHLEFEIVPLNGMPEMERDALTTNRNRKFLKAEKYRRHQRRMGKSLQCELTEMLLQA